MWIRMIAMAALMVGAACAGQAPTPSMDAKVSVARNARTVTVHGLSVTRPDGWEFVSADGSLKPDAELMLVGPITGASRASVTIYRKALSARQKRAAPDTLLTAFAMQNMEMMESFELAQEAVYAEIAGHPGASLQIKAAQFDPAGGESNAVDGRFYAIVDGESFWTVMAIIPDGNTNSADVDEVIRSFRL